MLDAMPVARLHLDSALPAAEALARGQALLASVSEEQPVLLYGAQLHGAAVALGAYQHAPHALRGPALDALALPVLRRRSGGAAVWASEGVLYFALGLRDASALMACPPGKLLNRNVRGFLAGARALPVPAHYFGRDFVSFAAEPGAYVAWDEAHDGRVLLEFFVGLDTPFVLPEGLSGYPERLQPPLRGKRPTTLRAAGARDPSASEVLEQIALGYAKGFALELERTGPTADELARTALLRAQVTAATDDDAGLAWSDPHEEAIGFVGAGARLDERGRFSALRVAGDFFQQRECPAQLAARLIGASPDPAGLDAVYAARPGLIEGVRSLQTLRTAVLEATERAAILT
jgi:hypothetical protein